MKFHQSYRMLAGLALGVSLGVTAHVAFGDAPALQQFVRLVTEPAGKIFLRLLFVLVLPLIVSALALGVSGLGDLRQLGRIGSKTLAYTVVVSTIAVLIGVGDGERVPARHAGSRPSCARSCWRRPRPRPPRPVVGRRTGVDFVGRARPEQHRSRPWPTATCSR